MRDGIKLYTEVFLPAGGVKYGEVKWPVILLRSPYPYSRLSRNSAENVSAYLSAQYVVVFQLCRGQGKSEGNFHMYSDEVNDGYDAIEWIASQPWCDGNVGMEGPSYLGTTQLLAAKSKPPALKCIMPAAFVGNATHCFPFSYGVPWKPSMQWFQLLDAERRDDVEVAYGDMESALKHPAWGKALRKRPFIEAADEVLCGDKLESYRESFSHPMDNEFWASNHFTDKELAEIDIPVFFTDGWYDLTMGPINYFSRMEKIQKKPHRYLLVGPWNHSQTYAKHEAGADDGERILPENGAVDLRGLRQDFFDRYLKSDKSTVVQEDRVRVYISGAADSNANVWLNFPTFPAPDTEHKSLYLHSQGRAHDNPSDGVMSEELSSEEPVDTYIYDPSLPTDSNLGGSADRRQVEIRADVLTYTTKPYAEPLTILGDITLVLHAASDCPDTDWFAVVTEVFPDGQSKRFHSAHYAFRARYREGFDREVFLSPNKPEEFQIPMGPSGHQIAKGNCLRLSIFSSAFPDYEPNSNTGHEAATDTGMRIAKQTIFHDTIRPSHLVLPIIKLD
jgi:putative CocE/NonD family hydrolase